MNKKIILFLLSFIYAVPTVVSAEVTENPLGPILCRIGTVVGNSAVAIVVIAWILVGVFFLSAVGNPERFSGAKKALFWVIVGTAVCLLAASAIAIINNMLGTSGGGINC